MSDSGDSAQMIGYENVDYLSNYNSNHAIMPV